MKTSRLRLNDKNLGQMNVDWCPPCFRTVRGEHLDSPHPALGGQNQFGIYQIDDDTLSELEQQIDFVDSYTLKNNYPNPDSFTHNYDATVGSCQGRAKSRLNQAFTGNRKLATDLNGKIDIVFSELMRKFDTLSVQIKRLDSQVAENTTAIKRETGRLAGRTDANPKRQVNAVLLRSGKRLIPRAIEINNTEKHDVVEETGESRSRPIDLDDPSTESGIPRERQKPNTEEEAIELEEEEGEIEEDAEIDRQGRTSVDRQTKVNIDRRSENNVDRLPTPAEPAIERVYRTLPPFPPNKTQTKRELDKAICKKAFDKITLEMPLSDAIKVIYHGFDPFSSMELKRDFIRADHWRSIRRRSNRSMHIQCRRSIHKRSLDD
ncbi:hypothetical protein F2Q70_00031049 [Brassica cretica]|uniref:Uncharacterized protein n=1 Tax=Brassica cretica TaxID=69181 RepID=A0A8S9FPN9_BRACR|nr:hypothetical protein F2Q70_00031049 [Brassica cretica]